MNELRERRFAMWLDDVRGLNRRTVGSRLGNCGRVEKFGGSGRMGGPTTSGPRP